MNNIKENMIDAIKVQFLQPVFEDDFPERGMKAWLTGIERLKSKGCWRLYFDFSDFEQENEKYLRAVYYDDKGCATLTAKQNGLYTNKYDVFFGDLDVNKFGTFEEQINKYLMRIE